MIFNINQFKESSNYFDYCIIGCGVAGITLALKLSIFSKVIIVESGGFELDERNQRLNQGKIQYNGFESNHGEDYLSNLRLRMIGGTSNHWTGYCCPFRKIDFKNRHYINKKEWPINYSEYLKYVDEASTICKLNGNFNLPNEFKDSFFKGQSIFLPFYEQISQSPNFKDNYLEKLINNKNVTILYNANLDRMLFESKTIKKLRLKSLEGEIRFINSKNVILATGAAENFRILKDHLEKYENDLIQIKNSLGKNFMEHLTVPTVGYGLRLAKNNESAESHLKFKNKYGLIHYELSEEIQKKFALYNNQITIRSSDYIDDITKLSRNEIEIVKILKKNYSNDKKLSIYKDSFFFRTETPHINGNEYSLIDEVDQMGKKRIKIKWSIPKDIKKNYLIFLKLFGEEYINKLNGRIWIRLSEKENWTDVTGGAHMMGGTQMSSNSLDGCVDVNLKVFGTSNLYAVSTGIFPTSGGNLPTMNLVAFSLRLADYFRESNGGEI